MLAKFYITCNLLGCKIVTSQTITFNLAYCICQQEFVYPKTENSLPNSWSLSIYIHSFAVIRKLITRSCTFVAKKKVSVSDRLHVEIDRSVFEWIECLPQKW